MKFTESLPEAPEDARLHSDALVEQIRREISADQQGSITFRRYMEMALYQPGLGYYVAGANKLGEQGDFITAPEVSPLFARCLATQCAEILTALRPKEPTGAQAEPQQASQAQNRMDLDGSPQILELGAGSGIMAADLLKELERINCLPARYYILDLSPDLKALQQATLENKVPGLLDRIVWLDRLPQNFHGVILGNEVLDAMPVELFTQQHQTVFQHHVIWDEQQQKLVEQLIPAPEQLAERVLKLGIPADATPYTSELNPNLDGWMASISDTLTRGILLLIDYGYPRKEYYQPDRKHGTLICHYRHRVNEAPLYYPGLQDITANVDFTAVAESAHQCGLKVAGYTSQTAFLTLNELEQHYLRESESIHQQTSFSISATRMQQSEQDSPAVNRRDDVAPHKLAQQIRTLTLPAEMGERFKVIALSRDCVIPLRGFSAMDQLRLL